MASKTNILRMTLKAIDDIPKPNGFKGGAPLAAYTNEVQRALEYTRKMLLFWDDKEVFDEQFEAFKMYMKEIGVIVG